MGTRMRVLLGGLTVIAIAGLTRRAAVHAHCDTMDGPVVTDAKRALADGDVTLVVKWVKKEHEDEIRAAFGRTQAVRKQGPEARELADRYFFETLIRVHRAGEGAPYTGLKPAGTDPGPAVKAADKALEDGSVDALVKAVTEKVGAGIRKRFVDALAKRRVAARSVEAGRQSVAAYVEFVHYVERLHHVATHAAAHHGQTGEPDVEGHESHE